MISAGMLMAGIQSSLLLLTAGLTCALLMRSSAALRHYVWTIAFALLLLLPLWPEGKRLLPIELASNVTRIVVTAEGPVSGPAPVNLPRLAFLLWAGGAGLLLMRAVVAQVRGARLADRATAWRDEWRLSPELAVPVVLGPGRPRILLPADAAEWPSDRLEAVLAHERMHIARGDLWWQCLAQVACAVYWPNPLVWIAARLHYKECEQACDDGAVRSGIRVSDYAGHLVAVARSFQNQVQLQGGLPMTMPSTLEHRLLSLLNPLNAHRPVSRATMLVTLLLSAMLLAPIAALKLVAQQQAPGVQGTVVDAGGGAVPDAKVSLLFLGSSNQRRELTRSSAEGAFSFPEVPEGHYTLTVEKAGFATLQLSPLRLGVEGSAPLKVMLNVGGIQERSRVDGRMAPPPPPPPPPTSGGKAPGRIRVGGNVQSAKLVSKVPPIYPQDCRREGVQGIVLLSAVIDKDGGILSLTPVNEFVDARLREAAMTAVKLWRYEPTLLNGNPVEIATQIEVSFTLTP